MSGFESFLIFSACVSAIACLGAWGGWLKSREDFSSKLERDIKRLRLDV